VVTVPGPWWKKVVKRFRRQIIVSMTPVVKMKGFAHFRMGQAHYEECLPMEIRVGRKASYSRSRLSSIATLPFFSTVITR
jgi:hypothetical protein